MPIFEVPFSGTTQILPSFLIAVGVADSVHILSVFYRHFDEHGIKSLAIRYSIEKTAIAVLMTSVTTAAGLLSFMFADVIPTRMLGIYGALGVSLALIYTVVLIPALLMLLPIKQHKMKSETTLTARVMSGIDAAILWLGKLGIKHSTTVLVTSFFITVIVVGGLFQLSMSNDAMRWYPENHPVRIATESIDKHLNGSWTMEVVVDTQTQGGLYEPKVLKFIEELISNAESMDGHVIKIKGSSSILDVVKQNHQALNENNPEYYEIPDNKELIAQELLLFENSGADDLQQYAVSNFSKTRITFFTPMVDAIYTRDFLNDFQMTLENTLSESGLSDINAKAVGFILVSAKTTYNMAVSTIESYILAFALVGALMFVMMGGIRKGVLAFVPNMVPIVLTLGIMGWLGIPLNFLTALIGCVIIGISVDDTIHFMHHFQDRISEGGGPEEAITNSLTMAGRAITFTSIALIGCFIIYAFDVMKLSRDFGLVLSISIFVALIANLVLAPALLMKFWKFKN
jgi:predicted RND superfamily exporter protein